MKKSMLLMVLLILVTVLNSFTIAFGEESLGTWETKESMPTARSGAGVVEANGKIYAIGGRNGSSYFNVVEEYDPATDKWTTKESMPTTRYELGVAEANGKIYAIGGYDSSDLNVVEEYDPATDKWTTKESMPTPRSGLEVVEANGKIYAIGGRNGGSYLNVIEEYDPATDKWTTKESMPTPRRFFGTAKVNGKIYAIGGHNSSYLNVVEEYDPATDKWITKESMPTTRSGLGVAQANGKIYAIGGYNGSNSFYVVEEYDPITNKWTTKASMSIFRTYCRVIEANGKIYAIGGYGSSTLNAVEEYTPPASTQFTILNIEPEKEKISLNEEIIADIVIDNITEIAAEDIKIDYDEEKLEFLGFEEVDGMKLVKSIEDTGNGELRVITASKGEANIVNAKAILLKLKFKGIQSGEALVDITRGRVTDGIELEKDLTAEECGDATIIIEGVNDVNNSGEFTLLDLGIVGRHLTKDPASV